MEKYHEKKTHRDGEYIAAYLETHSQIKAAKICGVGRETIARAVRRANIPLSGRKYNTGQKNGQLKITDFEIIDNAEKMPALEIAYKYNISPEKYIDVLKEYDCFLSPDFSLYTEMPIPMKVWNVYRSRMLGAYYQQNGVEVIPTMSWCEKETFSFCFKGVKGGTVAVSTIGVKTMRCPCFKLAWTK